MFIFDQRDVLEDFQCKGVRSMVFGYPYKGFNTNMELDQIV